MAKNTFATLGFLTLLVLTLGVVSAANFTIENKDGKLTGNEGDIVSFTINLTSNETAAVYVNWTVTDNTRITTTATPATYAEGSHDVSGFKFTFPASGSSTTLKAHVYDNATKNFLYTISESISFAVNTTTETPSTADTFCEQDGFGTEKGDLELSIEVNNLGSGDDEEWEYLDAIEIEVTVENTHDEDNIDDVMVELEIRDSDGNTISKKDMDLDDDEADLGKIKDDDEEIAIFRIDELPIDLDEGTYRIYVRAYEDGNENNQCVSESDDFTNSDETYYEFEIVESDDATVIVKEDLDEVQASCGDQNVEVRFMVYNTGDDDEDKVLVTLENSKLGIYEKTVIENLRDGKGKEAVFYINVPEEVEKNYNKLEIYTYYDYDDDEDELDEHSYDESSEEEGDDFSIQLEILSCQSPMPSITAALDSATQVGTELSVKTSIKNNGNLADFTVAASGYESWADLVSVTPSPTTIGSGNTQEITIKLLPKESGAHTFNINVVSEGEVYNQPVSVKVAEEPGMFSGLNMSSTVLYLILGIASLLVLILLVVVVKVARRPAKANF